MLRFEEVVAGFIAISFKVLAGFPIWIDSALVLMAIGIIGRFVTAGVYDMNLEQLFTQYIQVTAEKWTEDMALIKIQPGFVRSFDFVWISHGIDLPVHRISNLFAGYGTKR